MTPPLSPWDRHFIRLMARITRLPQERASDSLPPGYPALTPPALAVRDVLHLHTLGPEQPIAVDLWHAPERDAADLHRLQVYSLHPMALDELMPYLQNLDLRIFDQVGFTVLLADRQTFIHSFFVATRGHTAQSLRRLKPLLLDALMAMLSGRAENDSLNGLLSMIGLPWQDIDVFRAYRNYYFQWNPRSSPERFHQALQRNPAVASLLFRYFEARFRPDPRWPTAAIREEQALPSIRQELGAALDTVVDGGVDRILRDLFNLIDASLRTNHYLRRDAPDRFIALKMDSMGVFAMPSPKPRYEIYVHSPLMEGVHLRGGKVARGGIRWSDRKDDFREEILDLMQTQMIKNALIVPHGAKGGFIVKAPSSSRPEAREQARAAYRTLIRGLLDLTDDRTQKGCTRPQEVIAYDDDDPYLVVAADKGTAHFSDLANAVASEYRFWLGDAFASGGSRGYDHKQLGITARGAWECVKRHFIEMGKDPAQAPFTVVGVGSMDGDVFGNGMLASRQIRLLGAFGSRHIFLDPNPDPERSFRERQRLFGMDGSSWTDYDPALISAGGGVFPRNARNIPLTASTREWLGIRHASVDGEELVRLLLTAPVDLLWLGGIGTYVKAVGETHDEAGDRANDTVRVDACQVRAKIVGEGANLGFTQKGRIEYAQGGGRINTDAVDNSGGVDLSDHEVNLKIFMAHLENRGLIAGPDERDYWLAEVRDEVCSSVLTHNARQSLCLSLDMERCTQAIEPFLEAADQLARAGHLDLRAVSFPSRKEVAEREERRLTRPDLAILMPCSKLALKRTLLEDGGFIAAWKTDTVYTSYFPEAIRERFAAQLPEHSLAHEIAAAQIANRIINRAGSSFLVRPFSLEPDALRREVSAYLTLDRLFEFETLRTKIRTASLLPIEQQYRLLLDLEDVLARCCHWLGRHGRWDAPGPVAMARRQRLLTEYLHYLEPVRLTIPNKLSAVIESLDLAPREASLLASFEELTDFPALLELAERTSAPMALAAETFRRLAHELGLIRLLPRFGQTTAGDRWERKARSDAAFRLRLNLIRLAARLIDQDEPDPYAFFARKALSPELERFKMLCRELTGTPIVPMNGISAVALEFEGLLDAVQGPNGFVDREDLG